MIDPHQSDWLQRRDPSFHAIGDPHSARGAPGGRSLVIMLGVFIAIVALIALLSWASGGGGPDAPPAEPGAAGTSVN